MFHSGPIFIGQRNDNATPFSDELHLLLIEFEKLVKAVYLQPWITKIHEREIPRVVMNLLNRIVRARKEKWTVHRRIGTP
jgi:hypothetical protein